MSEVNYIESTLKFPKETHEVGLGLASIISTIDAELEDGFQVSDLAAIYGSIKALKEAIEGYKKIPAEFKECPVTSTLGALTPIGFSLEKLIKG